MNLEFLVGEEKKQITVPESQPLVIFCRNRNGSIAGRYYINRLNHSLFQHKFVPGMVQPSSVEYSNGGSKLLLQHSAEVGDFEVPEDTVLQVV